MVGSFIHAPGFDSRLVQVDPGRRELGVISLAFMGMLELRSNSCLGLAIAVTHGNKVSLKSEHHHAKGPAS